MTRQELENAVAAAKAEVKEALQAVYDALNSGQQKKLLQNDGVKALFERYCVDTGQG